MTVEDKHGAKSTSRVNVFISDTSQPVEVLLTGPIKSIPGEPVKLVAEISNLPSDRLKSIEFRQVTGQPLKLEQCTQFSPDCQPGPFIVFKMPDCTKSGNMDFNFSLAVTDKDDIQYTGLHDLSLVCPAPPQVQVKLVGPSTPPFRNDIVELKTQVTGMQSVPGSYRYYEKSGPQTIIVATDRDIQANLNQGYYETKDPSIKVQMPVDCKPLNEVVPESEKYVFEVKLNDTNNREYSAESSADLICPHFIIKPSKDIVGPRENLTMTGEVIGLHKDQKYSTSIFYRQGGQNLGAGKSCLDSSCDPPFKEFVVPDAPCDSDKENVVFTGFVLPENEPKVWTQRDVAVTISCTYFQPPKIKVDVKGPDTAIQGSSIRLNVTVTGTTDDKGTN